MYPISFFQQRGNGIQPCVVVTDKGEEFTLVGSFSHISVSEKIKAKGRWKEHPVYGKQFSVEEYQLEVPDSLFGIEQYLASGAIKGIGKAIAARIVKKFKEDSLRIMEEEPERLAENSRHFHAKGHGYCYEPFRPAGAAGHFPPPTGLWHQPESIL